MTSAPLYSSLFETATGKLSCYAWQARLACGPNADPVEPASLTRGTACRSQLIDIPTGLGKTAGSILAWLWNRGLCPPSESSEPVPEWPRRLVYCLPMRTLVEQTAGEVKRWLAALAAKFPENKDLQWLAENSPIILMGGEDADDWDIHPERPAILIGTQDMLLSRALNRGYGISRYRWPMHFGLLNNDCLWVLDETQLMGVGIETSAQLDGFRRLGRWLLHGNCPTWWMSATLEDTRLSTVDHPKPEAGWVRLALEEADRRAVKHRLEAVKKLQRPGLVLSKQLKPDQYAKELAKLILEKHVPGRLTLVIVNRVSRAQEVYEALKKSGRAEGLALVHSRFREPDRRKHQDLLIKGTGDRIVIATQAVEAGVDVSARVLITELAPWSSLVQRFGRCNRAGEFNEGGADIHWINLDFEKDDEVAPYTVAELREARVELEKLDGHSVSPEALRSVQVVPPWVVRPVIRRKDLVDLFDTTPDIAGHDLDISRYIREGDDTDVQVFWRDLSASDFTPTSVTKGPLRVELCRVALHWLQLFLDKLKRADDGRRAYVWDGLRDEWRAENKARPGAVYLLDRRAGGYKADLGWTGDVAGPRKETDWVPVVAEIGGPSPDAARRDPLTFVGRALTLPEHTAHVVGEVEAILDGLALPAEWQDALLTAAHWHDVGKSQHDFQDMLRKAAGESAPQGILAKSGTRGGSLPEERRYFRHELASALAWLANRDGEEGSDLTAYVIAAHHGKVRLSIRSLPEEAPPSDRAGTLIARGILDGDELPELSWEGFSMPKTTLRLDLMRMGSDEQGRLSWLARMIALRDRLGPFTLAYLETLLRAADMRASKAEAGANAA